MSAQCLIAVEAILDQYDGDQDSAKNVLDGLAEYYSHRNSSATRFNERLFETILMKIGNDPRFADISVRLNSLLV